ncbi:hypothetical protein DVA67_032140 [Solirubrobacter sp. CPCC 204708]|uniref:Exo-alpha-sialidase n=1 Tax=Solirubrobacter deserti TaxID=2282478 RepID=A0ABT4RQ59_9ACTN|nr:hypothetical protein [Solirubrobacter deserti]MBE2320655.1 hypothetical protein [Solirubrobacter deserti]MDA0140708.1 hypothetical protein [Solirubrobacter deserti]
MIGSTIGSYRLPQGSKQLEEFKPSLTVAGKGEGPLLDLVMRYKDATALVASGHSKGGTLPENVGMITSPDGAKTWNAVSGIGEIDYHDLEVHGDMVVALRTDDPNSVQLSKDGGKTFEGRAAPAAAAALDVAINPDDPKQWAVGTESGTFISNNEGNSWRQRDTTPKAKIAWAGPGKLYSAGLDGKIRLSADEGKSWNEVGGSIGGGPKDFVAAPDDTTLYAYLTGGRIRTSPDGGKTWNDLVTLR